MKNNIDIFYFNMKKGINLYSEISNSAYKNYFIARANNALRHYNPVEWIKLRDYYYRFDDLFNFQDALIDESVILFIILSSYKEELLKYDKAVMYAIIESLLTCDINPYQYEEFINICLKEENYKYEYRLTLYNNLTPLSFVFISLLESYPLNILAAKNSVIFTNILKKIANDYTSPLFKNNWCFFNIYTTLKKEMESINLEEPFFTANDFNMLKKLLNFDDNSYENHMFLEDIKTIEDDNLISKKQKINDMLNLIKERFQKEKRLILFRENKKE